MVTHASREITSEKTLILEVSSELAAAGIGYGDILYTNKFQEEHIAFIVGWGPYLINWEQIENYAGTTPSSTYFPGAVPYVIDHGVHFLEAYDQATLPDKSWAELWSNGPKPYYALKWGSPRRAYPFCTSSKSLGQNLTKNKGDSYRY